MQWSWLFILSDYLIQIAKEASWDCITRLMFGEASKDDGCSEVGRIPASDAPSLVRKLGKELFSSKRNAKLRVAVTVK